MLLVVDLSSRAILAFDFENERFTSEMFCVFLKQLLQQHSDIDPIRTIHTDKESIFHTPEVKQIIKEFGVQQSVAKAAAFGNQVVERTNRSVKDLVRKKLNSSWKIRKKKGEPRPYDPLEQEPAQITDFHQIIENAVFAFNGRSHTSLNGVSPALHHRAQYNFRSSKGLEINLPLEQAHRFKDLTIPQIAKNDNSPEAKKIQAYKNEATTTFLTQEIEVNGTREAFLDKKAEERHQQNLYAMRILSEQNKKLYKEALETKAVMEDMRQEIQIMREKRIERENRSQKVKNRKIKPQRAVLETKDIRSLLKEMKGTGYSLSRRRCGHILLYASGMRISNLRVITVGNIRELLEKGIMTITSIKRGTKTLRIIISDLSKGLIAEYAYQFETLMRGKTNEQLFFTTEVNFDQPIHRSSLTHEMNRDLRKLSEKTGKLFRSHSYRITLLSKVAQDAGLLAAKDVSGHKTIVSVQPYLRQETTIKEMEVILNKIQQATEIPKTKNTTYVRNRKPKEIIEEEIIDLSDKD